MYIKIYQARFFKIIHAKFCTNTCPDGPSFGNKLSCIFYAYLYKNIGI